MKQYLKLLIIREGKEVLGKKFSNLWLLTMVLVATFCSIAFSEGSMTYLRDRMEDPFTNWFDIPIDVASERAKRFGEKIKDKDVQERYKFTNVHYDLDNYVQLSGRGDSCHLFAHMRNFESFQDPIVKKILENDNIVNGCVTENVSDQSFGVVITSKALERLGYKADSIPSYIFYEAAQSDRVREMGLKVIEESGGKTLWYLVPWPILAVVRKLPSNADVMATNFLAEQRGNKKFDFNEEHLSYYTELIYFLPKDVSKQDFTNGVKQILPDSLSSIVRVEAQAYEQIRSWMPGQQVKICFDEKLTKDWDTHKWYSCDTLVQKRFKDEGVVRIYNYDTDTESGREPARYLSFMFTSLDSIRSFDEFAKENGIVLDMSLVNSKENFNAVAIVARILSAAMIIFAIVCIIMFLVNMLQSYFQKVKRNLGTFKAFGMNTRELTMVYIIIIISIVFFAVIMALLITWAIQGLLPVLGIVKEGFNYLSLWNITTYVAIGVILASTILTVIVVMRRMLSQTPGDLIYDRN